MIMNDAKLGALMLRGAMAQNPDDVTVAEIEQGYAEAKQILEKGGGQALGLMLFFFENQKEIQQAVEALDQ